MIVDDSRKASAVLLEHGDVLSMTPVWAVQVPDRPAGLAELLAVLAKSHVDVEYMYSLFTHAEGYAYMVLRLADDDDDSFEAVAAANGIRIVGNAELGLK
jgi:hypothetical protein